MLLLILLALALCIGAGDTCNSISTLVGGKLFTLRKALVFAACFLTLGVLLEGWKVQETVAEKLVLGGPFFELHPAFVVPIGFAVVVSSFIFILLGLPVSTTQTMIASTVGAALATVGVQQLNFPVLRLMLVCWILAPGISLSLGFLLANIFGRALVRIRSMLGLDKLFKIFLPVASAYVAYANGANDGGALLGLATAVGSGIPFAFLVSLMMALGALLLSWRVVLTVGAGVTSLDLFTAFPAQFAAALTVWSFVQFGLPVSMTQALVGSVIGVGLSKGVTAVSARTVKRILVAWVLAPLLGLLISLSCSLVIL